MPRDRAEEKLLEPCRRWLASYVAERYRRARCAILKATERTQLRHALNLAGLIAHFPEASAWEVKVDVAAVIGRARKADLLFVELKATPISLRDVGQLLGYCRICRPTEAFLLSSRGLSSDLLRLLTTYGRTDVLEFGRDLIRVGRWNTDRGEPDWSTMIPPGRLATT